MVIISVNIKWGDYMKQYIQGRLDAGEEVSLLGITQQLDQLEQKVYLQTLASSLTHSTMGTGEHFFADEETIARALAKASPADLATARVNLDEVPERYIVGAKKAFKDHGVEKPSDDQIEQYIAAFMLKQYDRMNTLLGRTK